MQIAARSDYEKWGINFSDFYQACEGEKRAKNLFTKLNYSWRVQCKCTLVSVSRNAGLKFSAIAQHFLDHSWGANRHYDKSKSWGLQNSSYSCVSIYTRDNEHIHELAVKLNPFQPSVRPSNERGVWVVFVKADVGVFEREDGEVGPVEEHGSTASLRIHPHHRHTRVVQQTSLQESSVL